MSREDYKRLIKRLPKTQRKAFDKICCGDDSAIHPKTLEALLKKGLIRICGEQQLRDFPPIIIMRYEFTLPAHIAWCELMTEQHDGKL